MLAECHVSYIVHNTSGSSKRAFGSLGRPYSSAGSPRCTHGAPGSVPSRDGLCLARGGGKVQLCRARPSRPGPEAILRRRRAEPAFRGLFGRAHRCSAPGRRALEISGLRPAAQFAAAAVSRSGGGAIGRRAIVSGLPLQAGKAVCPNPPTMSRRAAAPSLLAAGLTVAACAKREASLTVTVRDAATSTTYRRSSLTASVALFRVGPTSDDSLASSPATSWMRVSSTMQMAGALARTQARHQEALRAARHALPSEAQPSPLAFEPAGQSQSPPVPSAYGYPFPPSDRRCAH